jgi:peroxiredoxin
MENQCSTALLSVALAAPALPSVDLGEPAPLFMLPAINEDAAVRVMARPQVELAELVGVSPRVPSKAVVLYFFERARGGDGLGALDRVHRQFSGKGVRVVGVSTDGGELGPLATWIDKEKIQFPVVRDEFGVVRARYGISQSSLPLTVVLDSTGRLFAVGQPPVGELEAAVAGEVMPLVKNR